MRRNSLFPAAALLAALVSACGPSPQPAVPPAETNTSLEVPEPSSMTVKIPLTAGASGYDNESQVLFIQEESKRLGIETLNRGADADERPEPVTYEQGLARTKHLSRQFELQRLAIEKAKGSPSGLGGSTPAVVPAKESGGPIESAP